MAEYISRDDVKKAIHRKYADEMRKYPEFITWLKNAVDIVISEIPTADVQPVRHGQWLHDRRTQWKCSECGNFLDFDGLNCGRGSAFYCPNCGADMRGEQE